jgi:hypothetical protein
VVRAILASRHRSGLSHVYSEKIFAWNLTAKTRDAILQYSETFFPFSLKTQLKPQGKTKHAVLDLAQPTILSRQARQESLIRYVNRAVPDSLPSRA